jgi:hypothetical protein
MSTRRIPMMTEDEIQTELGWIRPMIYSLLDTPDSDTVCRLYRRERVTCRRTVARRTDRAKAMERDAAGFHPEPGLDTASR